MSTLTNALTTKEKVKSYLGISVATDDTMIDMLIDQSTSFIESYCGGRKFLSQSYTDIVDTKGGNKLFFYQFPVSTLTSVEYRSGTPSTPIWSIFNVDTYLLYDKAGYVGFFGNLPKLMQAIRLKYTAGYLIDFANEGTATHTLPVDLTMACTMLVAHYYTNRQASGMSMVKTEGQEVRFKDTSDALPSAVKQILGNYQTFRYAI